MALLVHVFKKLKIVILLKVYLVFVFFFFIICAFFLESFKDSLMTFAPNNSSLLSDQDINQFLE